MDLMIYPSASKETMAISGWTAAVAHLFLTISMTSTVSRVLEIPTTSFKT